jgi:hypothetical protein
MSNVDSAFRNSISTVAEENSHLLLSWESSAVMVLS